MKSKKVRSFIIGGIFSIFLTIGFILLAVPGLSKKVVKTQNMYSVNSSNFVKKINLPKESDYVFKIKYEYEDTDIATVTLNGHKLERRVSNKSEVTRTSYYYALADYVRQGDNNLKIHFYLGFPPNVDVRIKNYIASTEDKNIILTMRRSLINQKDFIRLIPIAIFFFIFSFALWSIIIFLGKLFNLPFNQIILNNVISFSPCMILYFVFGVISVSTPYSLAITPSYLFVSLFIITLVVNIPLNFLSLFFLRRTRDSKEVEQKISTYEIPSWLEKSLSWLKTREFSDKCILLFIFLLIMCAFLLILGLEWLAEQSANIAYFTLVIGVVIKFVKFVRGSHSNKEKQ